MIVRFSLPPLVALISWLSLPSLLRAAVPAYSFVDFEAEAGWTTGALPAEKAPLRLIQGAAAVVAIAEKDSAQVLALGPSAPFAAVFVATTVAASAPVAFCEMLARPFAVAGDAEAEFVDFGGAIVGFFRNGARGEVRALFARSAEESVWISTGRTFALDETGNAADWLRIVVRLDRRSERWDLRINGTPALAGLRALEGRAAGLALWLYGQETQPCLVDDVLVTTVEPEHLEKLLHAERRRALHRGTATPAAPGPQLVLRAPAKGTLRSVQPRIETATRELAAPVLHAWELSLRIGDTTFRGGPEVEVEGRKTTLLIYSPRTDDDGKTLPGVMTITADAELHPGTDLSRLRWISVEMKKWPDEWGEVIAAGDFRTGLVQTVTIPPEWIRKAAMVNVWTAPGRGDVPWWRFRQEHPPAVNSIPPPAGTEP